MPHVERNDALKNRNSKALQRYQFAIECLAGKSRSVIDFGCGLGYGCHLLREAGHKVMGVDNSSEAFDYCRNQYPGPYYVADIEKAEFKDFEVGVCLEALCHLRNPEEFIKRIYTDELIVSAPINPNPNDGYQWRLHNLSEVKFKELFKEWTIVKEFRQKRYLVLHLKKKI